MRLVLDHLAVAATTLAEGTRAVEAALGVELSPGGEHAHMATHNRLLNLGDIYLEVIAINPDAPPPAWPRWFDLDRFTGPPRLTNWICRCDELEAAVAQAPPGTGVPVALTRGDLAWRMAVPADGRLPFDNAYPALIQWQGQAHPVQRLPDRGIRLQRFEIIHPDAQGLQASLKGQFDDARVRILPGPAPRMQAWFDTPQGLRAL